MDYSVEAIRQRLEEQDNLATAHPIYMVQVKHRLYGIDPDYGIVYVWQHVDDSDFHLENDEELEAYLDDLDCVDKEPFRKHFERVYYAEWWENKQPFLTMEGAEAYIEANKHNMRQGSRVYVESGYRNEEWQKIREVFMR